VRAEVEPIVDDDAPMARESLRVVFAAITVRPATQPFAGGQRLSCGEQSILGLTTKCLIGNALIGGMCLAVHRRGVHVVHAAQSVPRGRVSRAAAIDQAGLGGELRRKIPWD